MSAVWLCVRPLLRRRIWGTLAVAALVGVAGGAVLAAAAGARRTETAYPRLLEQTHAADVKISQNVATGGLDRLVDPARLADLPHAERVGDVTGFGIADRGPDGRPDFEGGAAGAASDGVSFYELERPVLEAGRMPRKDRAHEIGINEILARRLSLRPGDTYRALTFGLEALDAFLDQLEAAGRDVADATDAELAAVGTPVDLRVTGIGRSSEEIVADASQLDSLVLLTPAFAERYVAHASYHLPSVELDEPRNLTAFEAAARGRYPDAAFAFVSKQTRLDTFAAAVGPYADALWLFALIAALTSLLVVGQTVSRVATLDAADESTLSGLGMRRGQITAAVGARGLVAALLGGALAVMLALVLSPLFPIGPAGRAEPAPGIRVDALALVLGLIGIVVVFGACAFVAAWRAVRLSGRVVAPGRRAPAIEALARAGVGPSATIGVGYALQRDRRAGTPSPVATLLAAVTAITTIAAALVFAVSLDRMVSTPRSWGWNWDYVLETYDSGASPELIASVRGDDDFRAASVAARGAVLLADGSVLAVGFDALRGHPVPQVLDGRFPAAPDEIALGTKTLRDLHRSVGDTVRAEAADGSAIRLRIVGRTVLPALDLNATLGIGTGAALTLEGLRTLDPGAEPSFFVVDLAPRSRAEPVRRRYGDVASLLGAQLPGDISSYEKVRGTPLVLTGVLALLGIGVLVHGLVTSVNRRRRDLAVLKAVGFSRRQVSATVAWHATTVALVAVALGTVLGTAAGRAVWTRFAGNLGSSAGATIPALALALLALATIVIANLVSALPARTAARTAPALVLRAE